MTDIDKACVTNYPLLLPPIPHHHGKNKDRFIVAGVFRHFIPQSFGPVIFLIVVALSWFGYIIKRPFLNLSWARNKIVKVKSIVSLFHSKTELHLFPKAQETFNTVILVDSHYNNMLYYTALHSWIVDMITNVIQIHLM